LHCLITGSVLEDSGATIAGAGREGFPTRPGGKFLAAVMAGVLALLIALGYQYLKLSKAIDRRAEADSYSGRLDFYIAGVCYAPPERAPLLSRTAPGNAAPQLTSEDGPAAPGPVLRLH